MLDEGIAREVVNRIQKLRKKVFALCFDKYIICKYFFPLSINENNNNKLLEIFHTVILKEIKLGYNISSKDFFLKCTKSFLIIRQIDY